MIKVRLKKNRLPKGKKNYFRKNNKEKQRLFKYVDK